MSCRVVYSTVTGTKVNSQAWDNIYQMVGDEFQADKLYAQFLTPQFKAWFGDWTQSVMPNTFETGEPRIQNGLITNTFGDQKSIMNNGSFLSNTFGGVSIVTFTQTANEDLDGGEIHQTKAYQDGKEIGVVYSENDGTYLTTFDVEITRGKPNAGTYTILQMAEEAKSKGLQLRSDRISDRMSDAYIALWNRFVNTGQAELQGDRYIFTGNTDNVTDNIFYNLSSEPSGDVDISNQVSTIFNSGDTMMNLKLFNGYKSIPELALSTLSKNGFINKFNPHNETVNEDRWYFNQSVGLETSQRLFHQYMAMNNLNEDMFKEGISSTGIPYVIPNKTFNPIDSIAENNEKIHKDKYQAIVDFFKNKFGIETDKIIYTTKAQFAEQFPDSFKENMTSAYSKGKFYFFTHNLTADITTEELLHPFVYTIMKLNPELYSNLLSEAERHYPLLQQKIQVLYKSQPQVVRNQELVTQALTRVFNNVYENEESKSFFDIIKNFVKWMTEHLNNVLKYFGTGKTIHLSVTDLHPLMSMEEIAQILNATDTKFDIIFPENTFYNMSYSPDDFNKVVTSLLTDKRVEAQIDATLADLPDAIRAIKKRLTSKINDSEKKELQTAIKEMEELAGEDKQALVKAQLKGIVTTARLLLTLRNELNSVDRSDLDDNIKLGYYMSILKTAQALGGFKDLMIDLEGILTQHLRTDSGNIHVKEFHRLINSSIAAEDKIIRSIQDLIKNPLVNVLNVDNDYKSQLPLADINKQITDLETQIANTSSLEAKTKLQRKLGFLVRERADILKYAPTKENLIHVADGEFKDANRLSYIFESNIANHHPLINTLQARVNNIYDRAAGNMLNSKNEAQTMSDEFTRATGLGLRNVKKRYEGIGDDLVRLPMKLKLKKDSETELELDKDGNHQFEYISQNALVQEVDNNYITKYLELEMVKDHYGALYSKDLRNDVEDSEYKEKYHEAKKIFNDWIAENSEREFNDDYYEFRAIMSEEIGGKTLREIAQNAYDEIDDLQGQLLRADTATRDEITEAIKEARVKLKALRSEYNDDGSKKEGDDLKVAQLLSKYNKLRYEYGDDVLTEEGDAKYKFDLDNLERLKKQYDIASYNRLRNNIQQRKISADYFDALATITDSINSLTNRLTDSIENSPIAQYLEGNVYKQKHKDVYKEIRDWTRQYRDEDGVIDGITLTKSNKELVKRIKDAQQYVEDLKYQSTKMWDLSNEEANEYKSLRMNKDKTLEQQERYQILKDKRDELRAFKSQNIDTINELQSLFKEFANFSLTTNTDYFEKMKDRQLLEIKANPDLAKIAISFIEKYNTKLALGDITYIKKDGKWYEQQVLGNKVTDKFIGNENDPKSTGLEELINLAIAELAQQEFKQSSWWKDNHYIVYNYDAKSGTYEPTERALYIWEHREPANPNFIEETPAKKYYSYQIKDKHRNENFDTIYRSVPIAKKGKWINDRYTESMANPAKAKMLTYLRDKYNNIQKILPDGTKMGHVLPAIIHTKDENYVDATNAIRTLDFQFAKIFKDNFGKTDNDTSFLVGGSQENNKTVPIRFIGRMDTSHQTRDTLASILLFEYHTSLYKALNDDLPVFEAAQLMAASVDTREKKSMVERLNIGDKFRKMFSSKEGEDKTQKKETEKSVLSKSVDNILDVFIYGQRLKPMIFDAGPFGKVDLAKVSTGVLGFAAKTLFLGNVISAVNNSISTRLQGIVNSGIKSNLYSARNLINAQAKAVKYGPALLIDWTKLGNKSLIGQVLEKFNFLAENPTREITHKTAFTYLKNKLEFLGSAKQMSEFEVLFIQFLTMADATPIKVNGKIIPLSNIEDVFEKDKNGNLKYKDGVEFTNRDEDMFRNKYQSMARKLAGAYRQTEISSIETNWAGKSGMFLRRYFVSMFTNRFKTKGWNDQEMEVQTGYQRETFQNLVKMFKAWSKLENHWHEMSDKEKVSFYKTSLEYGTLFLLIGLLALAGGNDDKKKLKENSWWYNMMLVSMIRAKSEMEQFTVKGTDDLLRIGKNPFMIFNTLSNIWKIIGLTGPTIMGDDSAYFKQGNDLEIPLYGKIHEKGDSKLVYTLIKLFGGSGATMAPEEYYVNFKNAQNR